MLQTEYRKLPEEPELHSHADPDGLVAQQCICMLMAISRTPMLTEML